MNITENSIIEIVQLEEQTFKKIVLNLEFETRYIGVICTSSSGTFFCKRNTSHLFRKQNSLGINYELLTSPSLKFKWIVIDYQGQRLVTSRKYFLAKGKQFQFGKKGFELQVFLPIDEFGYDKAIAFERNNGEQSSFNFND